MNRTYDIGRPTHKLGYFEVTYRHAGALKTCCLVAHGFQDAIDRFKELGMGEYASLRETTKERFEAWFAVSLHAAQNLAQLRTGAHL